MFVEKLKEEGCFGTFFQNCRNDPTRIRHRKNGFFYQIINKMNSPNMLSQDNKILFDNFIFKIQETKLDQLQTSLNQHKNQLKEEENKFAQIEMSKWRYCFNLM